MLRKLWFVTAFLGLAGLSVANVLAQPSGSNSTTDATKDSAYKWIRNVDAVGHPVGTVMKYYAPDTTTYPGIDVSTSGKFTPEIAGVVVQSSITAGGYGWIQTHGYCATILVSSATAPGQFLWGSTTVGTAGSNSVQASSEIVNAFGFALGTQASSSSVAGYILK